MSGRLLVEARGLTKTYRARNGTPPFRAVDGIDFEFGRGEVFGFLGPNGAGKSSTMRMLGAISPVSAGTLRVLGMDPAHNGPEIRARIGVVPQDDCLDRELTVRENLFVYGRYFGLAKNVIRDRVAGLLAFAQLEDKADAQVETLSGGMRRRLTIARSLINEPEILLLDEPTTGLDPQARHVLWDRLYRLKRDGVTLIITTHYMDEAEQLCDRLAVMDAGRIVAEGSPRELIERARDARGPRAALRDRTSRPRLRSACAQPSSGSGSRCCRTASSSTPTTARRRSPRCTRCRSRRSPRSCGARRSRTSS